MNKDFKLSESDEKYWDDFWDKKYRDDLWNKSWNMAFDKAFDKAFDINSNKKLSKEREDLK